MQPIPLFPTMPPAARQALLNHLVAAGCSSEAVRTDRQTFAVSGGVRVEDDAKLADAARRIAEDRGPLGKYIAERIGSARPIELRLAADRLLVECGYPEP